jgi:hypothetical protein
MIHNPGSVNPVLAKMAKTEDSRKVASYVYLLLLVSLMSDLIGWSKLLEDIKKIVSALRER